MLKGQMFVCPTCNKEFKRKDNMRRYEQLLHNRPNGGKHQCGECGHVSGNLSTMKVHCKRVHEAKAASCTHKGCNKKYKHEYGLREHIKKAQPDVTNNRVRQIFLPWTLCSSFWYFPIQMLCMWQSLQVRPQHESSLERSYCRKRHLKIN